MKSLIYVFEEFSYKFIVFFLTKTHVAKQTMPVFYVNKTKFKPQATVQKSEIKVFHWVTLFTIPKFSNIWALLEVQAETKS